MRRLRTSKWANSPLFVVMLLATSVLLLNGCKGVGNGPSSSGPPPSVTSFTASSSTVPPGTPVTLTWRTANATGVTIDNGIGAKPANGTVSVNPTVTTTYSLVAQGSDGQTSSPATAMVTVNKNAPSVVLTANPASVRSGSVFTLSWTTTNAVSISFNPTIPLPEDQTAFALPTGQDIITAQGTGLVTTVVNYTATVTSADGTSSTGVVAVTVLPPLPVISIFTATPPKVASGGSTTLNWTVQNATSFSIDNGVGSNLAVPTGSQVVSPTVTTTYTATATGGDGTTVTQQLTVPVGAVTLTANPTSVAPGQTSTLTWSAPQANSVTIVGADANNNPVLINNGNPVSPTSGGSIATPPLTSTTIFTATAKDAAGTTLGTDTATVLLAGLKSIKHIIFLVQENRSFDNYFGRLGPYRASKGFGSPSDVDGFCFLCNGDPTLAPPYIGRIHPVTLFHQRTEKTHNLTPAWNESHFDLDGKIPCSPLSASNPTSNCKMDRFPWTAHSIVESRTLDPNGERTVGYYDETDLPYYYELATQFATSDRWFSPMLANTVTNREYLFSATSHGNIVPPPSNVVGQFTWPTIFDAMDNATNPDTGKPVSWKYYYQDNATFLSQWATWTKNNGADQGNVRCIGEWYNFLSQPNADRLLPDVVFIEAGRGQPSPACPTSVGGASGVDEHPDANIQNGAANTKKIIDALMNSAAWQDSVFILTFDEGGGVADHVPPFNEPPPDNIPPNTQSGDIKGDFAESGFRMPLIVVSPWTKPHLVSHINRDNTAILKLIETRFNIPALTARDAAQDDMSEFFDFTHPGGPPSLTAPGGAPWTSFLPAQPTCVNTTPSNPPPCDEIKLETHP